MHLVEANPQVAERVEVTYVCEANHQFSKVFAADAKAPTSWDCPHCGKAAGNEQTAPDEPTGEEGRTHWDMVLERRTTEELATILAGRLKELRAK